MRSLLWVGLHLRSDRRAVTALEYAMMAALIALAVVTGVTQVGTKALALWTTASTIRL
jgi:Flp pilus assembly pilin Flp